MSELAALRRTLVFYRLALLVVFGLVGLLALKLVRVKAQVGDFGQAGETWVVHLDERVALIEEARGDQADFSETYLSTSEGSVHLHAMGRQQVTPLHLHPASDEVTVIVSGTARVTHAWGGDGGVSTRTADYPPGSVLASPRSCAHEWVNPSDQRLLFNLVFTSPRFSGNFYVKLDDARLLQAQAPTSPAVGPAPTPLQLPELGGRLWSLQVAETSPLPDTRARPVMVWVQAGVGSIAGQAVRTHSLVHLEGPPSSVEATSPLSLLLFDVTGLALPSRSSAP